MKNYTNIFKNYLTPIATILTYENFFSTLVKDNETKQMRGSLTEAVRKSVELISRMGMGRKLDELDDKVLTQNNELCSQLNTFNSALHNLSKKVETIKDLTLNIESNTQNEEVNNTNANELQNNINKTSEIVDKINEIITESTTNNLLGFDQLSEIINKLLLPLNTVQKSLICNILTLLLISYLLWDILIIFYSDKLINYFNIENKYPRLFKWLFWRRKFQDYYIRINAIFVILMISILMFLDIKFLLLTFS